MATTTKPETKQVPLRSIVLDEDIQVRGVEPNTVSQYAEHMRAGCEFPPLILDKSTKRIVCGFHRYEAYKKVRQPNYKAACLLIDFADDAAIVRYAAQDNARHGRPLDTWDKKLLISRLQEYGDTLDEIAELLGVRPEKVYKLASEVVVVRGEDAPKPVKWSGRELRGRELSAEQYQYHVDHDSGQPTARLVSDLVKRFAAGMVNTEDDRLVSMLKTLHRQIHDSVSDLE